MLQPGQVNAGAIGAVAIDHRLGGLAALALDQVAQQPGGHGRVAGGGHRDLGRADDLAIGIHRDVRLVAVEAVGCGLVPVARPGVHGGDDPIRRGPLEDPEAPVAGFLDVLTGDGANNAAASATRGSSRWSRRA